MVITTDRRAYHIRLVSTESTALSSMRWTHPRDELLALERQAEAARAAEPVASGLAIDRPHFNYAISGDEPAWRPLRAFDDRSEEHTSELQSLMRNSYAGFRLKQQKTTKHRAGPKGDHSQTR